MFYVFSNNKIWNYDNSGREIDCSRRYPIRFFCHKIHSLIKSFGDLELKIEKEYPKVLVVFSIDSVGRVGISCDSGL